MKSSSALETYLQWEERRLRGGKMLQQGMTVSEVANSLRVTRQTVAVWQKRLAEGGSAGLKCRYDIH